MPGHVSPRPSARSPFVRRRALPALGATLLVLALAGCGLFGEKRVVWAYDETSGLYYMEGLRSQLMEPVQEHLPQLGDVTDVEAAEAKLADPDAWFAPPAPDDDVWQAVLTLGPEGSAELAAEIVAVQGDGAAGEPDPPTEDSLHDALVPTLDDLVGACTGGWADATTALAAPDRANVTASGLLLQHAAFCEDSGQLVVELRQM